jgi:molybdopterin molybdotransferase
MIALDEAQKRLFALAPLISTETIPLLDASGRWAADAIIAKRTQPARDLSAMDGYAVRFADFPGPWTIIGESVAGRQFAREVAYRETARIFTGAVVPEGADTVIVQEDVTAADGRLSLAGKGAQHHGAHIRARGADFESGNILVNIGERLTPPRLGLAAMGGHATISVHRKLRVAIVSTGDELVPPGGATESDQIPASNGVMLAALLDMLPVMVDDRGIVGDNIDDLVKEFSACSQYDIVVTLGGASVGDHDLVRPAFEASGAELDFWKVAMRPGKPVMAGRLGESVVLGLPGNPVSAYVTAMLFLVPLIAQMSGSSNPLPKRAQARLSCTLPQNGDRLDHLRARLADGIVAPTGKNDSAMLASLAQANALIVREPQACAAESGDFVEIIDLA